MRDRLFKHFQYLFWNFFENIQGNMDSGLSEKNVLLREVWFLDDLLKRLTSKQTSQEKLEINGENGENQSWNVEELDFFEEEWKDGFTKEELATCIKV